MADRPYTLLSCAMSLDGYLDSSTTTRLALSNDADFDRVDGVRADCDAILVGANTIRNDDPALLVRSGARREERLARNNTASPTKVTITGSGRLAADAQFFVTGDSEKLVYCATAAVAELRQRLAGRATVVDAGAYVHVKQVAEDLSARGVNRLLIEGGGTINTQFLAGDLVDELNVVLAPFFVGDPLARRFVNEATFPWSAQRRATLAEVRQLGDVVLARYALSARFGNA